MNPNTKMNPPPKSIFKSKTAFAGALVAGAGAVGTLFPNIGQAISANANIILLCSGALQIALRLVSRGRVILFAE